MSMKHEMAEVRYGLFVVILVGLISYMSTVIELPFSVTPDDFTTECRSTDGTTSGCAAAVTTAASVAQPPIQTSPSAHTYSIFDEEMFHGFIAECRSMTEDTTAACTAYALDLMGAAGPTSAAMEPLSTGNVDETMLNGFIAECLSMTAGSMDECTSYAYELALP